MAGLKLRHFAKPFVDGLTLSTPEKFPKAKNPRGSHDMKLPAAGVRRDLVGSSEGSTLDSE